MVSRAIAMRGNIPSRSQSHVRIAGSPLPERRRVQAAIVLAIVYGGIQLIRRYGLGQRPPEPVPRNPLDL
jgi:hypothetical protein